MEININREDKVFEQWLAHQTTDEQITEELEALRPYLSQLLEMGVERVKIGYEGGEDDGEITDVELTPLEVKFTDIPQEFLTKYEEFMWSVLRQPEFLGWEIDEGSKGSLVLEVKELKVVHEHIDYGSEYENKEYAINLGSNPDEHLPEYEVDISGVREKLQQLEGYRSKLIAALEKGKRTRPKVKGPEGLMVSYEKTESEHEFKTIVSYPYYDFVVLEEDIKQLLMSITDELLELTTEREREEGKWVENNFYFFPTPQMRLEHQHEETTYVSETNEYVYQLDKE